MTERFTRRQLALISRVCWTLALCVVAIPFIFPFLWMLSAGLKSAAEIFGAPSLIPRRWQWYNYVEVFTYQPFAGREDRFRFTPETFDRVIRDYNTKDLAI